MSKELEALDRMSIHRFDDKYEEWDEDYETVENYLESISDANPSEALECLDRCCGQLVYESNNELEFYTIKQALLELKAIKEAKPSEALKSFENMQYRIASNISTIEYIAIKQALIKAQEQEKVLEIIKNIIKFGDDLSAILNFDTYEEYNEWSWDYNLTQEEFDLLKRYFK